MERSTSSQIVQMLNEMLEEERAAVEAVIGLTSMATDPHERQKLEQIGGDEVWSCSGLRDRIEGLGGTPSRHISDFASYVLSLDYYPERLRTYGRHQRLIMERITTLLAQRGLDTPTRDFLAALLQMHEADVSWCEQRANVFEASRYGGELPPRPPTPAPAMPVRAPAPAATGRMTRSPAASVTPPAPTVTVTPPIPAATVMTAPPAAPVPTPATAEPTPAPAVESAPPAEKPRTRRRRATTSDAGETPKGE